MISIAIDGPAGAGKSTMAKKLAAKLQYIYVDTGALYRSIGYYVIQKGKDPGLETDVESCLPEIQIELQFIDNTQHVFLNGEDVSDRIRTAEMSMAASKVSAFPAVRKFLFDIQRSFAKKYNIVMDGRDIGTVVLPNAKLKIFLTASAEDRAKRRYDEMIEKGQDVTYEAVLEDLKQRDYNDTHREISPLKPAEDSVLVDTTGLTLDEGVMKILEVVESVIH